MNLNDKLIELTNLAKTNKLDKVNSLINEITAGALAAAAQGKNRHIHKSYYLYLKDEELKYIKNYFKNQNLGVLTDDLLGEILLYWGKQ